MIWIRSQDKKALVPLYNHAIQIFRHDSGSFMEKEKPENILFQFVADGWTIGVYPTEVEALYALDMIEKVIIVTAKHPDSNPVFQMPEAGFSESDTPTLAQGGDKR